MVKVLFKRAADAVKRDFWKLFGLTLFCGLMSAVAAFFGGAVVGIGICAGWLFNVGLIMIYLRSFRGEQVEKMQLFNYFVDWKTVRRVLCGMGWQLLHVLLWAMIPIVGVVFAVIRTYEYRLVPYILANEPDVTPTEALKLSKERTAGYKGKMFGADMLMVGIFFGGAIVVGLVASLLGGLGILLYLAFALAAVLLLPVFPKMVMAAFHEEIMNPTMATVSYTDRFCAQCGAALAEGANFCPRCGSKTV